MSDPASWTYQNYSIKLHTKNVDDNQKLRIIDLMDDLMLEMWPIDATTVRIEYIVIPIAAAAIVLTAIVIAIKRQNSIMKDTLRGNCVGGIDNNGIKLECV